ncbi:phage tail protein [Desulfatiferula olefinivorans]
MVRQPCRAFNFHVEIGGLTVGGFSEVSGLALETDVKEYREGGENDHLIKRAGPSRPTGNLVLKHGVTGDSTLWDWYQANREGRVMRRSVSVILLDAMMNEVMRYNFREAYPVRWEGPRLNARGAEVAVETLELAHHGMRIA